MAAACLENLGVQPLVAILDLDQWWHALVGCWDPPEPGLESLRFDAGTLLERAIWVDPTCAARDREVRRPFAGARAEAERSLRERPLLFALDVTAARREEIMPLPFAGLPSWSPGYRQVPRLSAGAGPGALAGEGGRLSDGAGGPPARRTAGDAERLAGPGARAARERSGAAGAGAARA